MKLLRIAAVPAVLCGIGVLGLVADTWLVRAATHGNGLTSDPGYYERALAWDDHQEATANAARRAISITPTLARTAADQARLCVSFRDSGGTALAPTSVTVAASANLCSRARTETMLTPDGTAFCTMLSAPCPGLWLVDVRAELDGMTVAGSGRAELEAAP